MIILDNPFVIIIAIIIVVGVFILEIYSLNKENKDRDKNTRLLMAVAEKLGINVEEILKDDKNRKIMKQFKILY
jgi:hypothetical protein